MGDWTKGGTIGHQSATRSGPGGAPPPDEAGREISRLTDVGRAGTTAAASVCRRIFQFFGHFRPPHSSFPPFLDPLNSFPWSLFAYSSLFGSYDEKKVGRRLDRVFQPPQRLLDQGNGTDEFLVSWAFHLYVVCKFWTSFG